MQILFRTDAGIHIGTGHVMRCLTLANALKHKGVKTRFICKNHEGNLAEYIRQQGHICDMLPVPNLPIEFQPTPDAQPPHAAWLGCSWQEDLQQTRSALAGEIVDVLVVDNYALDARWESGMRDVAKRIMVIDDLADRPHDCDILLDQNLWPDSNDRYIHNVPKDTVMLLGSMYALLNVSTVISESPENKNIKKLLVFFGGSDATGECLKFTHAWQGFANKKLEVKIITGKQNKNFDRLSQVYADDHRVVLVKYSDNFLQDIATADFVIGASGASNWERFFVGRNTFIVSIADNQKALAAYLDELKLVKYLGHYQSVSAAAYLDVLKFCAENEPDESINSQQRLLVDGLGVKRVLEYLDA